MLRYLRRNPSLTVGLILLGLLVAFMVVGAFIVDAENAQPLSVPALQPPSWDYPFGTDRQGRDLFAALVTGTPLTLKIGFIAGFLGVGIGTVLAFVAGYYRGLVDTLIRGVADIGLTVPGLLVLIIIAVSVRGGLTVNEMALVVASLAWLNPTRTIRAQVLTLRERGYIEVARLSGIRVDWVKIGVYVLCSTLAALTGLLYLTRAGVGDPVTGEGAELQAITAVILGGTSLFGGQGGLIGTLGGVLLMGLTNNVLVILNVSSWYQDLIQGLVIVGAVALYKQKRR